MIEYDLENLIKHRRKMLLLDRLVSYDEGSAVTEVTITPQSTFFNQGHVPAWVGVEYAAQTVAALSGLSAKARAQKPKVGFLLSCRNYKTSLAQFMDGDVLSVRAEEEFNDGKMGAYKCSIHKGGEVVASVSLSAYIPENLKDMQEGM